MPRKKKQTVWHKKRSKFIPSTSLKPHSDRPRKQEDTDESDKKKTRLRKFAKNFSEQIKKAVREE